MNVLGIVPRINPQNVLGIVPRIVSFPGSFSGSFRAGAAELSLAPAYPKWIRPKRGVWTFHCACACSNWPRVEMAGMHSSGSDEPPNDPERRCLSDGDVKKAVEAIQYLSSLKDHVWLPLLQIPLISCHNAFNESDCRLRMQWMQTS